MRGPTTRAGASARWLVAAVPLLLIVVATTQIVVASTSTLTPWRGGGFGMFSTVDAHDQRIVRATVELDAGTELPLDLGSLRYSPAVDRAFVTARAWPTERHLERLVSAVVATPLVVDTDGIVRGVISSPTDEPLLPGASGNATPVVTITVWQMTFDRDDGRVTPRELAELTGGP